MVICLIGYVPFWRRKSRPKLKQTPWWNVAKQGFDQQPLLHNPSPLALVWHCPQWVCSQSYQLVIKDRTTTIPIWLMLFLIFNFLFLVCLGLCLFHRGNRIDLKFQTHIFDESCLCFLCLGPSFTWKCSLSLSYSKYPALLLVLCLPLPLSYHPAQRWQVPISRLALDWPVTTYTLNVSYLIHIYNRYV